MSARTMRGARDLAARGRSHSERKHFCHRLLAVTPRILGRALICTLAIALPAAAQTTWNVPNDVTTIQGAITVAADGDTIEVEPGTYLEALDSVGRSVTLVGLGGADVTVVDATGLGASALHLSGDSASACSVRGFTFTGGTGTLAGSFLRGGGVYSSEGIHVLEDCVITDNSADVGGGVSAEGPLAVLDCEVSWNSADGGGGVSGNTSLDGCHVHHNHANYFGGGIYLIIEPMRNCLIEFNSADASGGGMAFGSHEAENCIFRGNSALGNGGGVYDTIDSNFLIGMEGLRFEGNQAGGSGGGAFLSMFTFPVAPTSGLEVVDCLFVDNTAPGGDGLFVVLGNVFNPLQPEHKVEGCSFDGDQVFALHVVGSSWPLVVRDSILRKHVLPIEATIQQVSYSNVDGGAVGTGVIDVDPQWVDAASGDYGLAPGSPCIDTGDPASPLDADQTRADMGAYPFHPWRDLGDALAGTPGEPTLTGDGPLDVGTTATVELTGALTNTTAALVLGLSQLGVPFKGGVLVPSADIVILGLPTGPTGGFAIPFTWPAGVPSGFQTWSQTWITDPSGPAGYAATNGLQGTTR